MLNKLLKNKRGFTLIELIVVIAILGILAAVMVPLIGGFIEDAEVSDEVNTINTLMGDIALRLEGGSYDADDLAINEDGVFTNDQILTNAGLTTADVVDKFTITLADNVLTIASKDNSERVSAATLTIAGTAKGTFVRARETE